MAGLEDLYREIILDHYKNPRNRGALEVPPASKHEGKNPLCGDEIEVYVLVEGAGDAARVTDIRIGGQGCSISQSSASMMSMAIKGKSVAEARAMTSRFLGMMDIHPHAEDGHESHDHDPPGDAVKLGDLEALQGVVKFPTRIKCATLSWFTMRQGLDAATGGAPAGRPASTESPTE